MDVIKIKGELGTVVGQLLEYQFRSLLRSQQRKGQTSASVSSKGWIESVVESAFQPHEDVEEWFHSGERDTCDAVQFRYTVNKDFGALDLRISQTIFVITITGKPKVWPSRWKDNPERAASELGGRLLLHSGRLNLRRGRSLDGLTFGEQIIPAGKPSDQFDWLDTLKWWSDGTEVGFAALKRTGSGQSYKASLDLHPNQVWFDMFEHSRIR